MQEERLREMQRAVGDDGLDAWLFCDFRGSDPIGRRILEVGDGLATRRWFYCVPAVGAPRALVSAVEPGVLAGLPGQRRICFSIEPGIYLAGAFGVRSELNVFVDEADVTVTGEPVQSAVVAILGDGARTAC